MMKKIPLSFVFGVIAAAMTAIPARSAENLAVTFGPASLSVSVQSLKVYASTGEAPADLALAVNLMTPKQQRDFRRILQEQYILSPEKINTATNFFSRPFGQNILTRLGNILKNDQGENGGASLLKSFEIASQNTKGLTIVSFLENFPGSTIRVDLKRALIVVSELSEILENDDILFDLLEKEALAQGDVPNPAIKNLPDLRLPGTFQWRKETVTFRNPDRGRPSPADIYIPLDAKSAPLVIISHGLGSDKMSFSYLAEHLASYGYVVAAIEDVGTSGERLQNYLAGLDTPPTPMNFINRPLDIKYILDFIQAKTESADPEWRDLVNWDQVGAVGQSLGGYTVLAAGGATLDFDFLREHCTEENLLNTFNISEPLQCAAKNLPTEKNDFSDPRIKAVISINPLTSLLFNEKGMSAIKIPVMLLANTDDLFAPAVVEQIIPFTWLTTPNKYLLMTKAATHFSYIGQSATEGLPIPKDLIGYDPTLAHSYLKTLSLAFFNAYLSNDQKYLSYLTQSYMKVLNQKPFILNIINSLTPEQIIEADIKVEEELNK